MLCNDPTKGLNTTYKYWAKGVPRFVAWISRLLIALQGLHRSEPMEGFACKDRNGFTSVCGVNTLRTHVDKSTM